MVQNALGIFYGIVEKIDTESGEVLLRDGYALPSYGYITLSNADLVEDIEMDQEMVESQPVPTITELAANGPYILPLDGLIVNTSDLAKVPIISLSNVLAIVKINSNKKTRQSFEKPQFHRA